ncbi:hypothetical protein RISK_004716 [Rhodopirellula islandica]|uniref:Uncharacterized protein n=1 Tax=Rhodopirellula islandica TaxID=595434 RepID=A0A0J1ED17_RHOIS|nr:hypothetical protein RISK_004716 [Rhodopirellula islandica]
MSDRVNKKQKQKLALDGFRPSEPIVNNQSSKNSRAKITWNRGTNAPDRS